MHKKLDLISFLKTDISKLPKTNNLTYNYLLGIGMFYMMLMILSGLLVYKIIAIGPFMSGAGILVTPLLYCISNVVTEVYGYQVGRNMMWWFIIISAVFTIFAGTLIRIPSPSDFLHQPAFDLLLGSMPRVFIAGTIGILCGISINNFLVSKLKIIMNGKKYWLRSVTSTCGGEITYNLIAYPIMFFHYVTLNEYVHIIISATVFKITTTLLCWLPECIFAQYLKIKENINVFDYNVSYNIFRIKLSNPSHKPHLKVVKNTVMD